MKWKIIEGDVSWNHCDRPAYWDYCEETQDMEVYCSKCQEMLPESLPYEIEEFYYAQQQRSK